MGLVFVLGIAAVVLLYSSRSRVSSGNYFQGISNPSQKVAQRSRMVAKPASLSSPKYSVIPGGIHSKKQLLDVLATDPVVAKHYANFNAQELHFVRLSQGRDAYVSFRIGNMIFWTSRKIPLFAGETLITDGTNFARARCGNRISEVPRQPTTALEPSDNALSQPVLLHSAPSLPKFPPLADLGVPPTTLGTSAAPSGGQPVPPVFFLPPGVGSGRTPNSPNSPKPPEGPVNVPEPSTLILLSSGLTVVGLKHFWNSIRH